MEQIVSPNLLNADAELLGRIADDISPTNTGRHDNAAWWAGEIVQSSARVESWDFFDCLENELPAMADSIESLGQQRLKALFSMIVDGIQELGTDEPDYAEYSVMIGKYVKRELEYCEALESTSSILSSRMLETSDTSSPARVALDYVLRFKEAAKTLEDYENQAIIGDGYSSWHFERSSWNTKLARSIDGLHIMMHPHVIETRLQFLEALESTPLPSEAERLRLTETYGAKAANLILMNAYFEPLVEQMSGLRNNFTKTLRIPHFMPIEASLYEEWIECGSISPPLLQQTKDFISQAPGQCIIRSSAVYSEDGEYMGAGVYDSVLLSLYPSDEEITAAITAVYESVDTSSAKAYRNAAGLTEKEKMGLVIQQLAFGGQESKQGFANSVAAHNHNLCEYSLEGTVESFPFSRAGMLGQIGTDFSSAGSRESPLFFVPPDTKVIDTYEVWATAQLLAFSELVLGKPVQIEYAIAADHTVALLQARPLPEDWLNERQFEGFPEDRAAFFSGRSGYTINGQELTVEADSASIVPKKIPTLYVLSGSWGYGGVALDNLRTTVAEMDAEEKGNTHVLIERPAGGLGNTGYGHLETLFTELKIPLIFAKDYINAEAEFTSGSKVLIYSDGQDARVYSTH